MNKTSNSRKQLQLITILTGVMVPIIVLLSIMEMYYILGVAIVVELALIIWTVMLVKSNRQINPKTSQRD